MKAWKPLLLKLGVFLSLAGCANTNVVEVKLPPPGAHIGGGEYRVSVISRDETASIRLPVPAGEAEGERSEPPAPCSTYRLPTLAKPPALPERQLKEALNNSDQMIKLLTDHIHDLRRHLVTTNATLNESYERYQRSCKK